MKIYGAGLAGLLAGNMLRRHNPIIQEAQPSLPNNHAALLRFRTDAVSIATNIPFKKVNVRKAISFDNELLNDTNIKLSNLYSRKVTGAYRGRSIENLAPSERYIAPLDFISQASTQLIIEYGAKIDEQTLASLKAFKDEQVISTIPMNVMMGLTNWKDLPEFKFAPIWSLTCDIDADCDIYQTIYYPDPMLPYYRASITGKHFIVEFNQDIDVEQFEGIARDILQVDFGISGVGLANMERKHQKYGKLLPIDENIRRKFIVWLTNEYNIYSVGRFATWRQILMDDVVKDITMVEKMLLGSSYERNLKSVR